MFLRSKKKQSVVRPVCGVLAVLGILLFWFAATTNAAPKSKPRSNYPSFVQVEDVPGLARVLLIGDSISMQYTFPVRKLLEGKANVHRPARNCRHTRQTLEELDEYLGEGRWGVIHFNWGIHDVTHVNQEGKIATPPEGKHQVPLDEYKRNVRTLVQRLKQTGARLIWASTTPIDNRGFRRDVDVVAYNAAAAEVMQAEGVIVNDLYALVKPRAEKLLADGVHFTGNGSIVLAEAVAGAIQKALEDPREPDGSRELISAIGSEAATAGEGGKIATFGGKTHVVWQDRTKQGYFNVVRSLDHATGEWSETFTLNGGLDNHARPIITVDHNGYLHALMGGHNSPATYRRSVRPNDSSEWTDPEPAGSGTHPVVVCGTDDTLYLVMRSSNHWNGVDLYVKPPGKPWKKLHKLVKRHEQYPGFGAFHSGLAFGPDGTLHLVADFYESLGVFDRRGMHQAVCYMRSRDGGQTWQKADGTPVSLPARPEDMDILARDTAKKRHEPMALPVLLSQGCLVVDSQGTPHILYMSHLEEPGQLIHATADDQGQWNQQPIEAIKKAYPRMRPVNCRAALSIAEDNRSYVLLDLYPLDVGWTDEKPTRGMARRQPERRKLVWLISGDEPNAFTTAPALEAGATCHQPNLERPTGVNRIPAGRRPGFIYYDGQKNVYFVGPQ